MKKEMLYEGKAKQIFATDNQDEVLVYYKDDATAGNGAISNPKNLWWFL